MPASISQFPALSEFLHTEVDSGVELGTLEPGTAFDVRTGNSVYHLVVVDADRALVAIQGGRVFPRETVVRLNGSTTGGNMLKMGWIGVGFCLDITAGERRVVTSPVHAINLDVGNARVN